jgi:deaminated glutathione amidase
MTSSNDPEANYRVCASLAEQAAAGGAKMLFLPECFAFIGLQQQDALSFAQPLSGPLLRRYRRLARRHGLWMSLGGFQERCCWSSPDDVAGEEEEEEELMRVLRQPVEEEEEEEEEQRTPLPPMPPPPPPARQVFNAHVVVDDSGRVRAVYRKIHLFDVDVPGAVLMESRTTRPGRELVVVPGGGGEQEEQEHDEEGLPLPPCPCGPLGLTTCYDLRFPEMFAALAFGRPAARVLCVPSAFTKPTGQAHWEVLLRARAIETQCYVVAAAQAGRHSPGGRGRESFGHALVVDPWGEVVARVGQEGEEGEEGGYGQATGVAFADLSAERVAEVRRRMPIAKHRAAGRGRWVGGAQKDGRSGGGVIDRRASVGAGAGGCGGDREGGADGQWLV